jgi:NAD-dependent dihydropyrimidine dehydrogenase PreA subunit
MCEFCLKHGEGEKWYLQAKNYSEDLLSDVKRRKFLEGFATNMESLSNDPLGLERLRKTPRFLRGLVKRLVTRKMKRVHFGQIVPVEEIKQIFGFVNSIVRVACICRHMATGQEKRYCYGISMGPDGGKLVEIFKGLDQSFAPGPYAPGYETLTKEEAIEALHGHEKEGLCHSVWTFHTPFIGGICNCDRADCLAMRSTVTHGMPVMFRGEYVAEIDPEKCVGCRECMRVCQFGAVTYSAGNKKSGIDQKWCYGCGVCRAACKKEAIRLQDRDQVPDAANLW